MRVEVGLDDREFGQERRVRAKSVRANDPIKKNKMKGAFSLNNLYFFGAVRPLANNRPHLPLETTCLHIIRPHPQYGWDFPEEIPEEFRKDTGNALRAFPGIPVESTAGIPPNPIIQGI